MYDAAVLGLGWLGPLIDHTAGHGIGEGLGQLIWILLPIAVATALRSKGGDGFDDAGLRPRYRQNRRWYEPSSAFYPLVMLGAAVGGLLADHGDLDDDWAPLRLAAITLVALLPFTAIAEIRSAVETDAAPAAGPADAAAPRSRRWPRRTLAVVLVVMARPVGRTKLSSITTGALVRCAA